MIKAYIDNEEVVFNKDFTIKEEMLNTSSIVLNNVFPVEWDNKKDYVSNFYFPKDYSKCLIYEANDVSDFKIYGYCKQDGTPSPDHPVPIETFTGEQDIEVGGNTYHLSLGDLELCGIGDNKDYIYFKDNKWWKHKEFESIIFSDANGWKVQKADGNNYRGEYLNPDYPYGSSNFPDKINSMNNRLPLGILFATWVTRNVYTVNTGIYISPDGIDDLETLNNWFQETPMHVVAPLATPTEEEITDPTLLSQLELIRQRLIFAGAVLNTGNISLNPRYPHYCSIEVLDFKTFLSEGETLDFVISNKTIRQAIEMVVDTIKDYGFVVGNIDLTNADEVIGAYNCQEKTAYDVFQYIKDITQSQWTTRMLDENTVAIDFYNPETMPRAENIEYTEEYFRNHNIDDMKFSYSTDDYRNKQVMISDEVYGSVDYVENITTDGYAKQFNTSNNIAEIKSIMVNGVSKSFATKESEDLGISADFYYEPGKNQINSNDNESAIAVGGTIIITYIPLVYGRQVVQNNDEINRINTSTGRKGVIARYENRNDTLSSSELNAIGQSYLKYKGKPEITLTIDTEDKDLFDIGEVTYFEAPLDDLKQEYMVKSKQIRVITTTGNIFYTYTLSSSFNAENAINYFDNQRNKNSGNISAGNFITRNVDLNYNTQIIFQNLTITSADVKYDNTLNNGLNMALTK